jgi:ParB family transcriptional regulator, chromosome partitioning protein
MDARPEEGRRRMNAPTNLAGILTLAIDTIDAAGPFQQRRTRASAEADAGLAESIRTMGLLQPILVRWNADAQQHQVVDGHRRVAAARAAGLDSIRAVEIDTDDRITLAAGVAANLQREPLAPVDQWRAMVALQEKGWNLTGAALALGVPMRAARQLDRLGRLHPDIIAAIEAHDMPEEDELHQIASAPPEVQAAALNRKESWYGRNVGDGQLDWYRVAGACQVKRIPQSRAIFDTKSIELAWDEDLFGQPDDADRFTTRDIDGFIMAQEAALRARATRAKKLHVAEWDRKSNAPKLPPGWQGTYDKKSPGAERYAAVVRDGYSIGMVIEVHAVPPPPKAGAKAKGQDTAATTDATPPQDPGEESPEGQAGDTLVERAEDDDGEDLGGAFGSAGEALIPVKGVRGPITEKGRILVAQAKTTAIRCALRDRRDLTTGQIIRALVLAVAGDNVDVRGDAASRYTRTTFHDLVARLVNEDGTQVDQALDETLAIAAEAAARMIVCAPTGMMGNASGPPAEWIGDLLEARRTMPRLDTPEILATITGDALREIAREAGEKVGGSSKALRDRLAGNTPGMTLPGAAFGAPGPKRAAARPEGHVGPFPCAACTHPEECMRDATCGAQGGWEDEA